MKARDSLTAAPIYSIAKDIQVAVVRKHSSFTLSEKARRFIKQEGRCRTKHAVHIGDWTLDSATGSFVSRICL